MSPDNIDTITEPTLDLAEWKTRALVAERTCHEILRESEGVSSCDSDGEDLDDLGVWINGVTTVNIEEDIPKPPDILARESDRRPEEQPTDRILVAYGGLKRQGLVIAVVQRNHEYMWETSLCTAMAKHLGPEGSKNLKLHVLDTETDGGPTSMICLIPTADLRAMLLNAPVPSPRSVYVVHLALPKPSPEDIVSKKRRAKEANRPPKESIGAAIDEVVEKLNGSNPSGADRVGVLVTGRTQVTRKPVKKEGGVLAHDGSSPPHCPQTNAAVTCNGNGYGCPECTELNGPTAARPPTGEAAHRLLEQMVTTAKGG